ncbi:Conserved_hypothetical protein [Hexamita inflata]|uniref:Uncharacterized protein n=1 Tax=Hexamita inflata TaxID=28002 RepID=A0AA86R4G5_9EUKA|nr:Conserved hypothetical protein [Hexamita inflata]
MKTNQSPRISLTPLANRIDPLDECLIALVGPSDLPRPPSLPSSTRIRQKISGRDYVIQMNKLHQKYQTSRKKQNYRDKSMISKMDIPFSFPGDYHASSVLSQPSLINFISSNLELNVQQQPHGFQLTNQLMPGDGVIYDNGQQLISGIYSTIFTNKFGGPIYKDAMNPRVSQQVITIDSDDWYVTVCLRFSQVANFVKNNKNLELDLLQLTNEVIEGAKLQLTELQCRELQNSVLISLTSLKIQ